MIELLNRQTEAERMLLGAGRMDGPSAAEMERAALRLGIAGLVVPLAASTGLGTGAGAGAATAVVGKSTSGLKWLMALGVAGGGLVLGSFLWSSDGASGSAPEAGPARAAIAVPALPEETVPLGGGLSVPAPGTGAGAPGAEVSERDVPALRASAPERGVVPTPPRASAVPAPKGGTLGAEIEALDSARRALRRGDSGSALSELSAYDQRHPRGLMRQEATLLRLEALSRAGRKAEAKSLAQRLLKSDPDSPHRKRIESLVGPL